MSSNFGINTSRKRIFSLSVVFFCVLLFVYIKWFTRAQVHNNNDEGKRKKLIPMLLFFFGSCVSLCYVEKFFTFFSIYCYSIAFDFFYFALISISNALNNNYTWKTKNKNKNNGKKTSKQHKNKRIMHKHWQLYFPPFFSSVTTLFWFFCYWISLRRIKKAIEFF